MLCESRFWWVILMQIVVFGFVSIKKLQVIDFIQKVGIKFERFKLSLFFVRLDNIKRTSKMFFPSRVFAQQNEPSYTSRYRWNMQTTNYLGGYDNAAQQNVYQRPYEYSYKPEAAYTGSNLYKPSSIDQTSRYFGNDRITSTNGSISRYYGKSSNNDFSRQNQTSFYQFKSRYDKYDGNNLESRYGIKISTERTYYNPSSRVQPSQQFQNNQNTSIYQNAQPKSKGRQQDVEISYEMSKCQEGKTRQKRSKSVNITTDYKRDMGEPNQGGYAFQYQSRREQPDVDVNYSVIAEKYGNLQKLKDQTAQQRKYPAILTNETPLFQAEKHSESSDDYSQDSLSDSNSNSDSDSDTSNSSHKKHKKDEMRPFDPNRQLFSQAQNDVFQQYAEQRINEIRAQRGQAPIKSQSRSAQQTRAIPPESINEDRYGITAQLKECERQKQSKSRKGESKKRQPEVKFAFKSHEDIQEQIYGSQRLGTSVTFAPNAHNPSAKPTKSSNMEDVYQFETKYDGNDKSNAKKEKPSPSKHKSTSHKDQDDTADIMSKLSKFRQTIEESKRTERQLGELLGFTDKPKQTKMNENCNSNQTEKDSLVSGKANQPEFQSEPSLIFEDN